MHPIEKILKKHTRTVIGLMSGTSHDGVDAVVAKITGSGEGCRVKFVSHSYLPYPRTLRERVAEAMCGNPLKNKGKENGQVGTAAICRLNFELGEFFAKAALRAIGEAGMTPQAIDLIGSHGQTICHIPPKGRLKGCTLQIAEGAVIAQRTGIVTVSDFRTADVAAGGQGAPLVPMADWLIFREVSKTTALQNIGGMSNVTLITEQFEDVMGFDTGPGCALMDDVVKILSGGKFSYDKGGKLAKNGKIIPDLLAKLLKHPFFKQKPPKSTGREEFGKEMASKIVKEYKGSSKEDILCTLAHLTAMSIRRAYEDFVFPAHGNCALPWGGVKAKNPHPSNFMYSQKGSYRVLLAGGGAKNPYLVSLIKTLFPDADVLTLDALGIPVSAREALCFAVLANETISGNPGNVPAATGARWPAILGKISL